MLDSNPKKQSPTENLTLQGTELPEICKLCQNQSTKTVFGKGGIPDCADGHTSKDGACLWFIPLTPERHG